MSGFRFRFSAGAGSLDSEPTSLTTAGLSPSLVHALQQLLFKRVLHAAATTAANAAATTAANATTATATTTAATAAATAAATTSAAATAATAVTAAAAAATDAAATARIRQPMREAEVLIPKVTVGIMSVMEAEVGVLKIGVPSMVSQW